MKKRLFALCAALFIAAMSITVSASEEPCRLRDMAKLLNDSENAEITALLDEVSEKYDMDIAILTVEDITQGRTPEKDATELYEDYGYDTDGVMLYISIEDREWYMLTTGFGITAITDAGREYISDKFVDYLSSGDYEEAFKTYIQYVDEFVVQAKTGKPYDVGNLPLDKAAYNRNLFSIAGIMSAICLGISYLF